MEAEARVFVFVQRGAVEPGETVDVDGEVRGHPIEQHADPRLVRTIDEAREAVRIAEARGGCIQSGGLIAP